MVKHFFLLEEEASARVKHRCPNTPQEAILNQVEASLENKLVEFVSGVKDTLNNFFTKVVEDEESEEDFRTPENESNGNKQKPEVEERREARAESGSDLFLETKRARNVVAKREGRRLSPARQRTATANPRRLT